MLEKLNSDDIKKIDEIENSFSFVYYKNSLVDALSKNPFKNFLIYLDNDKIVGLIEYDFIYDRIEICNFNVLDEYQNRHIGSLLLKEVINISKNNNVVNISLEVKKNNDKAIGIYKKFGFVEKAIRKNYYDGIDGILMVLELNRAN